MKKFLVITFLILLFGSSTQASEWKNKNKWKISCGVVDKESLVVNGKNKRYSKNEFKLIETNELNERTLASPVPHKGFLLIRTELGLWKIAS